MPTPPPRRPPLERRPRVSVVPTADTSGAAEGTDSNRNVLILVITAITILMVLLMLLLVAGGVGLAVATGMFSTGEGSESAKGSMPGAVAGQSLDSPTPSEQGGAASSTPTPDSGSGEDPAAEDNDAETAPSTDPNEDQSKDQADGSTSSSGASGASGGSPTGNVFTIPGGEFFGITTEGASFVYLVDCSGSMKGRPLQRAKQEIKRSVASLTGEQSFYAIFFDEQHYSMFHPRVVDELVVANDDNKAKLAAWVDAFVSPEGGTDPSDALRIALKLRPEIIYLLTDGDFDGSVVPLAKNENVANTKINTVSFVNKDGEPLLKKIADQNQGQYIHVP